MMQVCSPDGWINGNWMSCMFDPITGLIGEGLFALLLVGCVVGAFWLANPERSPAAPAIALMLLSGLAMPLLPGQYSGIAFTVMFLGLAAGIMSVAGRWVLE